MGYAAAYVLCALRTFTPVSTLSPFCGWRAMVNDQVQTFLLYPRETCVGSCFQSNCTFLRHVCLSPACSEYQVRSRPAVPNWSLSTRVAAFDNVTQNELFIYALFLISTCLCGVQMISFMWNPSESCGPFPSFTVLCLDKTQVSISVHEFRLYWMWLWKFSGLLCAFFSIAFLSWWDWFHIYLV